MKKILVPIDFSVSSSWGYYYAYDLAAAIGAELVVLHMYMPYKDSTFVEDVSNYLNEQEHAQIEKRTKEVLEHMKSATQRPISETDKSVETTYVIDYGEKKEITHYVELHSVDLIVMGTHGAGNAFDKVWGSNTSEVIKNSTCPVLAIPPGVSFQNNLRIAYATDYNSKDIQSISQLGDIASATNSTLHCVHVNLFKNTAHTDDEEVFEKKLKDNFKKMPITFSSWSATEIEEGLEIFCRVNKISVLAILTRDRTTWNNLFGKKSMARFMALRGDLPLLVFHE